MYRLSCAVAESLACRRRTVENGNCDRSRASKLGEVPFEVATTHEVFWLASIPCVCQNRGSCQGQEVSSLEVRLLDIIAEVDIIAEGELAAKKRMESKLVVHISSWSGKKVRSDKDVVK